MDVNAEIATRATAVLVLMQDWLAANPALPAAATAWEVAVAGAGGAAAPAAGDKDAPTAAHGLCARARELLATDDAGQPADGDGDVWPVFLALARRLIRHLEGLTAPESELPRLFAAPQPLPPAAWRRALRRLLYQDPRERLALCAILGPGEGFFEPLLIQALLKDATPPPVAADRQRVVQAFLADPELLAVGLDQARLAVPFTHVLGRELEEIARRRNEPANGPGRRPFGPGPGPFGLAENAQLMGLALSGGGIRSATFALGAVQALAQRGWLPRLDYLSTVSGGGYLGSWLVALIQRLGSVRTAQQHLDPTLAPNPRSEENRPVRWLRDFSNYLTPQATAFSTDTWTMLTTWLRNALLNQAILVLFLSAVLLLPHQLLASWKWLGQQPAGYALGAAPVLLALAAGLAGWQQRWYDRIAGEAPPSGARWPAVALPVLLLLAGWCLASYAFYHSPGAPGGYGPWFWWAGGVLWGWLLVVAVLGRYHLCFYWPNTGFRLAGSWLLIALTSALAAALGAVLLLVVARYLPHYTALDRSKDLPRFVAASVMVLGPAFGVEALALALTARMTLLGRSFSDERREWWGRLGAVAHLVVLGWVLLTSASLLLPYLLNRLHLPAGLWPATAAAWLALVGAGVKLAQGIRAPAQAGTGARSATASAVDVLTHAVPYVFLVGLLVLLVSALDQLLPMAAPWFARYGFPEVHGDEQKLYPGWLAQLVLVAFLSGLSWVLAWRVGVNEFSLHHFYKNRLLRAYLGASRSRDERQANPFTDFDIADDLRLCHLRHSPLANADGTRPQPYRGPLPLFNTALNVTRGGELAHQNRRAESFVFSPLYAGFDFARLVPVQHPDGRDAEYGFRPTHAYAYPAPALAPDPAAGGVHVGTAMAISGAAANPNMGYHSSPVTAFLLTLFNVRLGWWMGNPRGPAWQSADPPTGLGYLLKDLFGQASPTDDYVCLSDGGHFDNLGLYELVRRRCRYIVVCDGEEDAGLRFEGLANAIRRCRVDFGVEIDIDLAAVRERDAHGHTRAHAALGTITYPDRRTPGLPPDPAAPDIVLGRILYLKATLTGDEPVDVLEYARENPTFPHQSTSDQFFSEPQFESYRRLGHHAALRLFTPAGAGPLPDPALLFEPARGQRPHPTPSPAALRAKYFRTWATSRSR